MKIPKTRIDYIELYAQRLLKDPSIFKQQNKLINDQIKSSRLFFQKKFGKENFEENARKYLKDIGLLK